MQKKGGVQVRLEGRGQGGCEPRIELIVKMHTKKFGRGGGGCWEGGGERIEIIVKMQRGGGGQGEVRVDLNEELKLK